MSKLYLSFEEDFQATWGIHKQQQDFHILINKFKEQLGSPTQFIKHWGVGYLNALEEENSSVRGKVFLPKNYN